MIKKNGLQMLAEKTRHMQCLLDRARIANIGSHTVILCQLELLVCLCLW